MDRVGRLTQLRGAALSCAMAVIGASVGCKDREATRAQPSPTRAQPSQTIAEAPSPTALQIPALEVNRLEVTRPGGPTVVLERAGDGWQLRSPLSYPANAELVEPMAAVLGEIEIIERVAESATATHRLGDGHGITVRAHGNGRSSELIVGASAGDRTFLRSPGDRAVYTMRGHARRVFDLPLSALRDPVITDLDPSQIQRVVFESPHGRLALVPSRDETRSFVEETPTSKNFFSERATQSVMALAQLRAKGFVDAPLAREATGLYGSDTPRAQIQLQGRAEPLTIFIGARTKGNRLHLRTSESEQVFLVSGHFLSTLVPDPKKLERTDEEMRRLRQTATRAPQPGASNQDAAPGEQSPKHDHDAEMPTQVPAEMLQSLRAIAASQRVAPKATDAPAAGN